MIFSYLLNMQSHPSWVCGLKRAFRGNKPLLDGHTLRGCVDWNIKNPLLCRIWVVTPFVGVWIETGIIEDTGGSMFSHTLRGCVDWNNIWWFYRKTRLWSHPSWVCGLKQLMLHGLVLRLRSHPSWVCGLKLNHVSPFKFGFSVTPFVGVWIET